MSNALIVVDAQKDFMKGGALEVPNAEKILRPIHNIVNCFEYRFFTFDWHPKDHCSFKENGGQWPEHCVIDTSGSSLHDQIRKYHNDGKSISITKGYKKDSDSYSGFYDENGSSTGLTAELRQRSVDVVYIAGLATEYCIKFTALDAMVDGFKTIIITDAIAGLEKDSSAAAIEELIKAGAATVSSKAFAWINTAMSDW